MLETLADRLRREAAEPPREDAGVCRGTILSRSQYLVDTHLRGYRDARLQPLGNLTAEQIERWTEAAAEDGDTSQLAMLESEKKR